MARVEIYVKTFCPYCYRAQHLLDAKGVEYEVYSLDGGGPRREEMIQRANGATKAICNSGTPRTKYQSRITPPAPIARRCAIQTLTTR